MLQKTRNIQAPLDPPEGPEIITYCYNCGSRFSSLEHNLDEGDPCPDCEELGLTEGGEPYRLTEEYPLDYPENYEV